MNHYVRYKEVNYIEIFLGLWNADCLNEVWRRLTERFKELRACVLSIKHQRVIDGVVGPTHSDQQHVQAAWRIRIIEKKDSREERWEQERCAQTGNPHKFQNVFKLRI